MKHTVSETTTLLDALRALHPKSSNARLRKMLTQGRILVNGEVVHRAKHELVANDQIELLPRQSAEERTPPPAPKNTIDLDVLFEDDTLLVVNKPSFLLSIATDRLEVDTLHGRCVDYIRQFDPKAWCYIVHRLDRETSGIMVLAKSKHTKQELQDQFAERNVHRMYRAVVEGRPHPLQGTVRTWLMEDKHLNVKAVNKTHPKGKEAISHYTVVTSDEETSSIDVMIETGRRHQIRMAMQHLGTPVVGDERHGAITNPNKRVMLHASALEFLHPETDDPVRFEAPLPASFPRS